MKVGNTVWGILCIGVMIFAGCASYARYTHDEIKHYPVEIQEKIIKGEIVPGMTQQQVRYAWGAPNSVRLLEPEGGKPKEEWIYSTMGVFKTRLTFVDGKLVYIISSEPGRLK